MLNLLTECCVGSRNSVRAGIVQEVRDRQYYEKPNQKKHSKNQEIKRRRTIEQKKAQQKGYRHPLFR